MKNVKFQDQLCKVVNLNNHKMVVVDNLRAYSLESRKDTPRTEYNYQAGDASWKLNAGVSTIKNLSLPMKQLGGYVNLVVSRETLRAVNEIEARLLKKADLWKWLTIQKHILKAEGTSLKKKLRRINSYNVEREWPEFDSWLTLSIPSNERIKFLEDIKKYVLREDLWSPGPRVKDKNEQVIACEGLIQIDSFWKGILW